MVHRGPDDEGVYLGDGVGLGMRRLSIIDLDGGQQPMSNEDGPSGSSSTARSTTTASCGATARAARPRVPHRRATPKRSSICTRTSARGCVEHLRGMFAFAIWDDAAPAAAARARPPGHQAALLRASSTASSCSRPSSSRSCSCPRSSGTLNWEARRPPVHVPGDAVRRTASSRACASWSRRAIAVAAPGRPLRIERYWDVAFAPDERATEAGARRAAARCC